MLEEKSQAWTFYFLHERQDFAAQFPEFQDRTGKEISALGNSRFFRIASIKDSGFVSESYHVGVKPNSREEGSWDYNLYSLRKYRYWNTT